MHLSDHTDKNISETCLYMTSTLCPEGPPNIVAISLLVTDNKTPNSAGGKNSAEHSCRAVSQVVAQWRELVLDYDDINVERLYIERNESQTYILCLFGFFMFVSGLFCD